MQFLEYYKKIITTLAIVATFSTVGAECVFARDVEVITNVIYSSQNTGGVSQKGADGKDGEDGKDGKAGKDGTSGSNVITSDGKSSASVRIESTPDKVIMSQTSEVIPVVPSATHTATSSEVEIQVDLQNTSSNDVSSGAVFTLHQALFSLQLMLAKYVNLFF